MICHVCDIYKCRPILRLVRSSAYNVYRRIDHSRGDAWNMRCVTNRGLVLHLVLTLTYLLTSLRIFHWLHRQKHASLNNTSTNLDKCLDSNLFILFKNFTVELKCKLKKLINDNSHKRTISRRCTNRYLQCKHGTVQPVQAVDSRTIASTQKADKSEKETGNDNHRQPRWFLLTSWHMIDR